MSQGISDGVSREAGSGTGQATSRGVVSFDLDGTLIRGPFGRVLADVARELAGEDQVAAGRASMLQAHHTLLAANPPAAYDWENIILSYAESLGKDVPFDIPSRLQSYATAGITQLIHDDTLANLARLRDAGWRIVVATNGWRRFQEPVIAGIGLEPFVDEIITSDDVGAAKPSAEVFAAALAGDSRHIHVGDRIDHDVVGANRAGAISLLMRPDLTVIGQVSDLSDTEREQLAAFLTLLIEDEAAGAVPTTGGVRAEQYPDLLATNLTSAVALILAAADADGPVGR